MLLPVILSMSLASVTYCGLVYSPSYANVRYQGMARENSHSDMMGMKEEGMRLLNFISHVQSDHYIITIVVVFLQNLQKI